VAMRLRARSRAWSSSHVVATWACSVPSSEAAASEMGGATAKVSRAFHEGLDEPPRHVLDLTVHGNANRLPDPRRRPGSLPRPLERLLCRERGVGVGSELHAVWAAMGSSALMTRSCTASASRPAPQEELGGNGDRSLPATAVALHRCRHSSCAQHPLAPGCVSSRTRACRPHTCPARRTRAQLCPGASRPRARARHGRLGSTPRAFLRRQPGQRRRRALSHSAWGLCKRTQCRSPPTAESCWEGSRAWAIIRPPLVLMQALPDDQIVGLAPLPPAAP
jgi:hypothetical protein